MKWEKVKLKDCCIKIGSGATPKGGATVYLDSGITFIRSQNVYNLHFDYDGITYITDDAAEKLNGVTIYENDILLNITGDSVARTCMVPKEVLPARVNQHVAIVRVNQDLMDSKFLSYYLASPQMQAHMLNLAVGKGASRNAITKIMIENFEVPCPPIETQRQIADILSAYDDLIENNQKQIKLLEEAAQRLYKEWFVDLRFPGYEQTKIIDGVPEGWEKGCLGDIAEFKRGKTITKTIAIDGNIPVVAGGTEPAYYHNIANTKAPVITVSASGANAGFVRMYHKDVFASDCSFADINTTEYLPFVYCFMINNKAQLEILQKGSAQPHVYAKDINAIMLNIPNENIIYSFCEITKIFFDKVKILEQSTRNLKQARDRLLPKLMSGEIEV